MAGRGQARCDGPAAGEIGVCCKGGVQLLEFIRPWQDLPTAFWVRLFRPASLTRWCGPATASLYPGAGGLQA